MAYVRAYSVSANIPLLLAAIAARARLKPGLEAAVDDRKTVVTVTSKAKGATTITARWQGRSVFYKAVYPDGSDVEMKAMVPLIDHVDKYYATH